MNAENRERYKRTILAKLRKQLAKIPSPSTLVRRKSEVKPSEMQSQIDKKSIQTDTLPEQEKTAADTLDLEESKAMDEDGEQEQVTQVPVLELSSLLSLELALSLIEVNKIAIRRCLKFGGLKGRAGQELDRGLEQIFVTLLQSLGQKHIRPAFEEAIKQLGSYKASSRMNLDSLPPGTRFTGNASTSAIATSAAIHSFPNMTISRSRTNTPDLDLRSSPNVKTVSSATPPTSRGKLQQQNNNPFENDPTKNISHSETHGERNGKISEEQTEKKSKQKYEAAPALTRFFELVHVADLVQQMIHVYYKQEIVSILF